MNVGAVISGGMNSWFAAYSAVSKGYDLTCMIAASRHPILGIQSKAAQLPLISSDTLQGAIEIAKEKYGISGVVFGVINSTFKKEKIEDICKKAGVDCITPIWHISDDLFLHQLMKNFHVIISGISAQGLKKEHLGLRVGLTFPDRMASLNISPSGEDGKFDTIVLDCPLFQRKIVIEKSEARMENECKGTLNITRATLV